MKLSLSMIVKNECETIFKALQSCELFVDEYVISVDDTTSDNTREEIERFKQTTLTPVRVFSFTWNGSFSDARNENIALCSGDYVFLLDGHEYVDERSIKKILDIKQDQKGFKVFLLGIVMHGQNVESKMMQARMFHNSYRYHEKSHNVLLFAESDAAKLIDCDIHHKRSDKLTEARSQQRREMNIKDLKERIKRGDRRAEAQIATEYMSWHEWGNAIKALNKYIGKPVHDNELYQVRINLAMSYYHNKQYDEAEKVLFECFKNNPEKRNAHLVCLASLYHQCGRYFKGIYYAILATDYIAPEQYFFLYPAFYTYEPWRILRNCYEKIGFLDGVLECNKIIEKYGK